MGKTKVTLGIKIIYVIMYGKRPIAAFKSQQNADKALDVLLKVIPPSYAVRPKVMEVPLEG
jgi:hypothetical protein